MKKFSDWHIHSRCSCDSACMEFETLVEDTKKKGITDFGVSDHYHTRIQEEDIALSRKFFDDTIERHPELKEHFHFGIEATIVSEWEVSKIARQEYVETPIFGFRSGGPSNAPLVFDFDEEFIQKYSIEYVIAGMHWPRYCATDRDSLIKEYHRQYMFAATHPYTTILAHYLWWDNKLLPNWWGVHGVENPFLDFSAIPISMLDELKAALIEYNTAYELNLYFKNLPNSFIDSYLGWAAELQRNGVVLSFGSDCHKPSLSTIDYDEAHSLFMHYGIDPSRFLVL